MWQTLEVVESKTSLRLFSFKTRYVKEKLKSEAVEQYPNVHRIISTRKLYQ